MGCVLITMRWQAKQMMDLAIKGQQGAGTDSLGLGRSLTVVGNSAGS